MLILRRILSLLIFILGWQIIAMFLSSPVFPSPSQVLVACSREFPFLLENASASLFRVSIGFLIALLIGSIGGMLVGLAGFWVLGMRDILELFRPIPPIAWVPLSIVWLGLGDHSAWFVVFLGAFFPIFIHTSHAFSRPPEQLLEVSKNLGASVWQELLYLRIPAATPELFQGIRIGLGLAWTSVIAAELVGVRSGLGDRIQQLRYISDYESMIVNMLVIGILGWVMVSVLNHIEKRMIKWNLLPEQHNKTSL